MSTFTYNGIELKPVKIHEIQQTPVYSPDGVDYLYTHFRISLSALYNPQMTSYTATNPPLKFPGILPATTDVAIRQALMTPQRQLIFANFGTNQVFSPRTDQGHTVDANNGPKPISCSIKRVDGDRTYHVSYEIETWIVACDGGATNNSGLISNRYSQTHEIDGQHRTIKTSEGTAFFRTDILQLAGVFADSFRYLLLPPISPGYYRDRVRVTAVPEGNAIQWSCVDEERFYDLGESDPRQGGTGVLRVEAAYGVTSMNSNGMATYMSLAQCDVQVWGNKYSNNWTLLQACFFVVFSKFPVDITSGFLRNISVRQNLTGRDVQVSVQFQMNPPKVEAKGLNVLALEGLRKTNTFGDQQGLNPSLPNLKGTRGTMFETLTTAIKHNVCEPVQAPGPNPISGGYQTGATTYGPPPAVEVNSSDILESQPSKHSASTQEDPYTEYKIRSTYTTQHGKYQAPVAGPKDSKASIVSLYAPYSQRVVEWTAERVNKVPAIPDPELNDDNYELVDAEVGLMNYELLAGNDVLYRISGVYRYASHKVHGPGDTLQMDAAPWMNYKVDDPIGVVPGGSSGIEGEPGFGPGILSGKIQEEPPEEGEPPVE